MTEERINELIGKSSLTAEEKSEIREAADAAGIRYTIKKGCRTCYESILMRLYEAHDVEPSTSLDGYTLKRASISFRVGTEIVNNETVKGMNVGNLHRLILDTYFKPKNSIIDGAISEV